MYLLITWINYRLILTLASENQTDLLHPASQLKASHYLLRSSDDRALLVTSSHNSHLMLRFNTLNLDFMSDVEITHTDGIHFKLLHH